MANERRPRHAKCLAARPMHSRWTFLFLLVSGCGARVAGEEGDPITPIPEEAYCTTAAKTFCPRLVDCCHAVKFDAEVAACETNYAKSCEEERRAKLAAGRTYDASAAAVCLATRMRDSKACDTPFRLFYAPVEQDEVGMTACSQVWRGATPLGGTCSDDSDCAGSSADVRVACRRSPDASGGVCAIRKRLGEGDACPDRFDICGGDLVCASDLGGARDAACGGPRWVSRARRSCGPAAPRASRATRPPRRARHRCRSGLRARRRASGAPIPTRPAPRRTTATVACTCAPHRRLRVALANPARLPN